jgi:hypothetical protein
MADNPRIEELRRRVLADPASIAFAALAEEYRRTGNFAEAIETCRTGLQRHPSYISARVTLGRALIETAQYEDARRELELVLKSAPENLAAIRGLAEIHERQGSLLEPDAVIAAATAQTLPTSSTSTAPTASPTAVLVAEKAATDVGVAEWLLPPQAAEPVPMRAAAPVTATPVTAAPVRSSPAATASVAAAPVTTAPVTTPSIATAPVTAAPISTAAATTVPAPATPVTAAPPDPAIARLEQFLVAIQSARASSRISQ